MVQEGLMTVLFKRLALKVLLGQGLLRRHAVMIALTRVLHALAPRRQSTVSQFVYHHTATTHTEFSSTADLRAFVDQVYFAILSAPQSVPQYVPPSFLAAKNMS